MDGLDRCESELDAAMSMFHVSLLIFFCSLILPEHICRLSKCGNRLLRSILDSALHIARTLFCIQPIVTC